MKKEIVRVLLAHIIATSIFTCGENAYNVFADELPKSINNEVQEYKNFDEVYIPTITHQMAMKWLREMHNIHIVIEYY